MRPTRAWLLLGPVVLGSVLVGHHLAYRLTGTSEGPEHDYLGHAQQALTILLVVGVVLTALGPRTRLPPCWTLPLTAVGTFAAQEHVERLVHTGTIPWLLTTPAFLVGLALQLPLAVLAWIVTRDVLDALAPTEHVRASRFPTALVAFVVPRTVWPGPAIGAPLPGRGPPDSRLP